MRQPRPVGSTSTRPIAHGATKDAGTAPGRTASYRHARVESTKLKDYDIES
jgi:hypothetical protein